MCEIVISLKPKFATLIEKRLKNHEFRKNVPKRMPNKIWIYVTQPVAELKYIAEVNTYVEYPRKISETGIGNMEFNIGEKTKFAYPIVKLHKLKNPISLSELKLKYGFVAPQNLAYIEKYINIKTDLVNNGQLINLY